MKVAFGSEGRVRGLKASESGFGVRGESEGDSRPVKVAFGSEGREVIDEGIDWDHISGGVLLSNPRPPRISLDMPTLSSRINPIDPPSLPPLSVRLYDIKVQSFNASSEEARLAILNRYFNM